MSTPLRADEQIGQRLVDVLRDEYASADARLVQTEPVVILAATLGDGTVISGTLSVVG